MSNGARRVRRHQTRDARQNKAAVARYARKLAWVNAAIARNEEAEAKRHGSGFAEVAE